MWQILIKDIVKTIKQDAILIIEMYGRFLVKNRLDILIYFGDIEGYCVIGSVFGLPAIGIWGHSDKPVDRIHKTWSEANP